MQGNVLIVSATEAEVSPLRERMALNWRREDSPQGPAYRHPAQDLRCAFLAAGVGVPETLHSLWAWPESSAPTLALQLGIAGSFDRSLALGQVVEVCTERYADLGAEDAEGRFLDLYTLGLDRPDRPPFSNGLLCNPAPLGLAGLAQVGGLTVNTVSGSADRIAALRTRCPEALESMEGAAFFDVCLRRGWRFGQLRAVSNYVEPRDRAKWRIGEAVQNLNEKAWALLNAV